MVPWLVEVAISRVLEWERGDRREGTWTCERRKKRVATRDGRTAGGGVKMLSAQQTLTRREMHGL